MGEVADKLKEHKNKGGTVRGELQRLKNRMDWKLLIAGIGFLTAAYLMYRWIRGERSFSETSTSLAPTVYIQCWFGIILGAIIGIVFIIESFF